MDINIVLLEPEIPHNTGAIGRVCVGLGARLHLIQPLGFSLREEALRRSGLDYWQHVDVVMHTCWNAFLESEKPAHLFFASTKGTRGLYDCRFHPGIYIVFGSEHSGLPADFYETYRDLLFRIPMPGSNARSINLANAVSIAAYEAYRQMQALSVARECPASDSSQ
jgi:tRNA (cytidine/uridine-2'-O-)-methyltransferase